MLADAGIHSAVAFALKWIPAFAGMTTFLARAFSVARFERHSSDPSKNRRASVGLIAND